jgi:TRAP-type mannitol/chloroaromatic compound transport system permease small subunit
MDGGLVMKFLLRTSKILDSINDWIGRVLCWLIVPLVLLTVMEVILRRFFGAPTIWSFEVLKQIYAVHFMTVAGYGLLHHSHVSVDIFTQLLSPKKRAFLEIVGYVIFFFPFCIICSWQGYRFAKTSWQMLEHTWSVFAPPLYPIKTILVITFMLLVLQGISEVIKKVFIIKDWKYD